MAADGQRGIYAFVCFALPRRRFVDVLQGCRPAKGASQLKVFELRPLTFGMDALSWTAWIDASPRRKTVLHGLAQPLTATQLAKPTGLTRAACSRVLSDLAHRGLARCLSPAARRSRVYGLTRAGKALRSHYVSDAPRRVQGPIDWPLFGWVCFRHRAAIVRALSSPMQPAEIKRRARSLDRSLRVSAGNVRDVVKLFLRRGIVSAVSLRKRAHPRYELTPVGQQLRELLISAEASS